MSDYFNLSLSDKLLYFETHLASSNLTVEQATEMLSIIHEDLKTPNDNKRADYAQYSRFIESFQHVMPDFYEDVIANWQNQQAKNSQESSEARNKEWQLKYTERKTVKKEYYEAETKEIEEPKEPDETGQ